MPLELTTGDYLEIRAALGERFPIDERDRAIYLAGMRAGIERAAKECDATGQRPRTQRTDGPRACTDCAAAIRALLK